jgi:hypothetical protein
MSLSLTGNERVMILHWFPVNAAVEEILSA